MATVIRFKDYNPDNAHKAKPKPGVAVVRKVRDKAKEMVDVDNPKDVVALVSAFESEMKKHRRRLKRNKVSLTETQGNLAVLKSLLKMTLDMMPIAEKQFKKYQNERAVYPIVALTNQIREIMTDVRQLDNNDRLAQHLMVSILRPSLKLIISHIVQDFNTLKEELTETMPPKRALRVKQRLNDMMRSHGTLLDELTQSVEQQLDEYLKT